jgi:hypothetical protein
MLQLSRVTVGAMVLLAMLVAACAPAPVHNVGDTPVRSNKANVTEADVAGAIKRAGAGLGWAVLEDGPGKMTATLRLRTHTAVVEIPYDAAKYSIRYKDSQDLRYNAEKGTIHKNYNSWIQNLDSSIQRELAALS